MMEKEKPKNTDLHAFLNRIDRILGLGMIGFSVILTVIGAIWFTSAETAIPFSFAAFAGLMFFVGILLILSDWLENHLNIMDEIEAFPHVLSYHLKELRSGRTTRAIYMWIATLLLILFTSYLIFKYDKWTHGIFGGISAVVMGVIIGVILAYSFVGTNWFQARNRKTPSWWFIVPAIAIIIASLGGIYFTEPIEYGGPTQWDMDARGREYNYNNTRNHISPIWSSWSSGGGSGSGLDIDSGDDVVGLIIIAIVVVLIIAALTIPHFWVTASIILCFLLIVLSIRDMYPSGRDPLGEDFHE